MSARHRPRRAFLALLHWHELPLLIGLVITWMALWREVSLMSVTSGIIVSILAMRMFYLPPVELGGRFNVWWAFVYVCYFLWQLAAASLQLSWLAVRPGPPPRTAIIEMKLRTKSDFILTLVGHTLSLIPGSLVAEVDRFHSTLYMHFINTPTEKEIMRARKQGDQIERLLIRAVGSKEELRLLR